MSKVKGAHVITAVKMLRNQRDRALELLPSRMHPYLEERILPSSWYALEDHLELTRACARLLSGGVSDATLIRMGHATARLDLTGLYKSQLRRGDASATIRWMAVMWKNAHDEGELIVNLDGPGKASLRLVGFPLKTREICSMATGYMGELVLLSIDREPKVVHGTCRGLGARECSWTVTWSL